MSQSESWSIGRLLKWTTEYLKEHGADSPRLDAEILLAEARGCERIQLYTNFDQDVDDQVRTAFRELVRRRAGGEPVAYLIGRREFYSMSFRVTPDVLTPRPETELLVVTLIDLIKQAGIHDREIEIADVGTGSGVIAICAAKHVTRCHVTAIDISREALDIAQANAVTHQVEDRIAFVHGDLLSATADGKIFDFVLSNPPYVSEPEFDKLPREVRDYEPRQALVAGPAGTEVIARLVREAASRLHASGWLLTEISPMIEKDVCRIFDGEPAFESSSTIKDLAGLPRIVMAKRR